MYNRTDVSIIKTRFQTNTNAMEMGKKTTIKIEFGCGVESAIGGDSSKIVLTEIMCALRSVALIALN